MILQSALSLVLLGVMVYAWTDFRRSPVIAALAAGAAGVGIYFVWFPAQSTRLAELLGVGRGVDLFLYLWVAISLLVLLNLHLKLRMQLELITLLARRMALTNADLGRRSQCQTNDRRA
jgi:hypothetical protein